MAKTLTVSKLGSPILRQKAQSVKKIQNPKIQSLIDSMIKTVKKVHGVGIAAPQVNQSLQIFILASHPNPRYPHAPTMEPEAMINPIILSTSKGEEKDWEGCLSIPGIRGKISRSKSLTVEYWNREGRKVEKVLDGFLARIFQHEIDHLNGTVILDRVETQKEIITDEEYFKL